MKCAVIGSRGCTPDKYYELVASKLDTFTDITTIISGGAKGADTCAAKYAHTKGITLHVLKPDYKQFSGKVAPLKRNIDIIKHADCVIVFWDGVSRGTKHAIDIARKAKKNVVVMRYNTQPIPACFKPGNMPTPRTNNNHPNTKT